MRPVGSGSRRRLRGRSRRGSRRRISVSAYQRTSVSAYQPSAICHQPSAIRRQPRQWQQNSPARHHHLHSLQPQHISSPAAATTALARHSAASHQRRRQPHHRTSHCHHIPGTTTRCNHSTSARQHARSRPECLTSAQILPSPSRGVFLAPPACLRSHALILCRSNAAVGRLNVASPAPYAGTRSLLARPSPQRLQRELVSNINPNSTNTSAVLPFAPAHPQRQ